MAKRVTKMEDILNQKKSLQDSKNTTVETKSINKRKAQDNQTAIPRGRPKSGRIWKSTKTKFSSIVKTRGIRNSFEKKQALRDELKQIKLASRDIVAARQAEKEAKKQKRRENLKRQAENSKKAEVVQVIQNPAKIKRMKKKQLRYIEKRDTTKVAK